MRRRDFLEHVGWTGAGVAWAFGANGLLVSAAAGDAVAEDSAPLFVQISDSHIGFHQAANPHPEATLARVVSGINALDAQPKFVMHTGDVTHLSKPEQFTSARDLLHGLRAPYFVLPGEHDFIGNDPKNYVQTFRGDALHGSNTGWYSWDDAGVHYVALVNVFNFEKMGLLGTDQLAWLERDLRGVKTSTPLIVFAHVPLYALYEPWGWTTEDGAKALAMLRRFDRVSVLNGHIHQVVRHTDGNIEFATAASTAYPQPKPGAADKPGPVTLPPDQLLGVIGYRTVRGTSPLAIDDRALSGTVNAGAVR